jgi:hypothetical protein
MTTCDTSDASAASVLQVVAHALTLGLPAPIGVEVVPLQRDVRIHVSESDWHEWRHWWNRHNAGPWRTTDEHTAGYIHHKTVGSYCGWRVTIVYLSLVEAVA